MNFRSLIVQILENRCIYYLEVLNYFSVGLFVGIYAFVVLKGEHDMPLDKLANELRGMVKTRISSFAQPDMILVWLLTWLPS